MLCIFTTSLYALYIHFSDSSLYALSIYSLYVKNIHICQKHSLYVKNINSVGEKTKTNNTTQTVNKITKLESALGGARCAEKAGVGKIRVQKMSTGSGACGGQNAEYSTTSNATQLRSHGQKVQMRQQYYAHTGEFELVNSLLRNHDGYCLLTIATYNACFPIILS
jgi:hypothetical protein